MLHDSTLTSESPTTLRMWERYLGHISGRRSPQLSGGASLLNLSGGLI